MPGLLRGVARVGIAAGTATAVSNRVSRRQARRWGEQDAAQAPPEQYQEAAAPPPPSADDPRIIQLQQLAELKGQGALTEEEFAAQKARILA
jgi:putative oligomerization/nucleic acid binding protein